MDKISVIVPVYKVEGYLEKCVNSLLHQTYGDFEIILVDDGSPDRCPQMCDDYAAQYENITAIHQKNGGLSAARNTGIEWALKNSGSTWITFVDSDDWVHRRYLELLLSSASQFGSDMVFGKFAYVNARDCADEEITDCLDLRDVVDIYSDETFDPNSACGRLFRKSLWQDLRFPVGKLHEDRFTTYKLLFRQEKTAVVDAVLYYYYMNSDGIVHSQWNYRKLDNLQAAEEQIAFFAEHELWEAWKITQYQYTKLLINAMKELKSSNPGDQKTYAILRNKLRTQLRVNGGKLNYRFMKDLNIYKYAWPLPAKIARRIQALTK